MIDTVLDTDLFWIIMILLGLLIFVLVVAAWDLDQITSEPVHIYDWTYRDDLGNTYTVTSASIEDNWDLLIRDHGLPVTYIMNHVFLADHKEVF